MVTAANHYGSDGKAVLLIAGGTAEDASANCTTSKAKAVDRYGSGYKIIELLLRLQL